jgi:hypothetical protein
MCLVVLMTSLDLADSNHPISHSPVLTQPTSSP